MKKPVLLLLVLALSLSLTGCGSKPPVYDETKLSELGQSYAGSMVKQDFAPVVKAFNATVAKSLSQEALAASWTSVVGSIGAYQSVYQTSVSYSSDYAVVLVILQYEASGLQIKFTFEADYKIAGLWMNYYTIDMPLVSNSSFAESKIQINADGNQPIDGIFTLPLGVEQPAVVILVQGSGQSDLNESIGGNKPFRDLAHGLAEKGIASIRYNKRFYQYPPADAAVLANLTVQQEITDDVAAAIQLAETKLPDSDLYIIGHSMGGMLAPYIASKNPQVNGIVSLAGTPRKLEDVMLDQTIDALAASTEYSDAEKADLLTQNQAQTAKIKALTQADIATTVAGQPASYWLSLNAIDTPKLAADLQIPMLILQGDADFQVKVETDFAAWQECLAGHTNVQFKVYPGLNHLFMPTTGAKDVSDYNIAAHLDQTVIDDLAAWINSR